MKLLDYYEVRRRERAAWNFAAVEQDLVFLDYLRPYLASPTERFAGDLLTLDRGPLFQHLQQLCRLFQQAAPDQRAYLRSRVDVTLGSRLESFGLRAAVAGARERSRDMVALGLAAFALADITSDVREVLMSMAVMLRCAELSGADPPRLFSDAASISGPAMAAVFLDFAARPPDLQRLAMMGWHEVATPEGVGFVHGASRLLKNAEKPPPASP